MAVGIEVVGPNTITFGGSTLGRSDNDDLFKIEVDYKYLDIKTNEFGEMPFDSVLLGAIATVSFSLIMIDRAVLASTLLTASNQTGVPYAFPKVGTLAFGNTTGTIVCAGTTQTITVAGCRLLKHSPMDHGNKPTRITFLFDVMCAHNALNADSIYTVS